MDCKFDEKKNTLLLDCSEFARPRLGSTASEMGFTPKKEFHITTLGNAAGKIITRDLQAGDEVLKKLYKKVLWDYMNGRSSSPYHYDLYNSELRIIEKKYDSGLRKSLVIMLPPDSLQTKFYHQIEALFPGIEEYLPIPHITIGVYGDHNGIGLTKHVWDNELTFNCLIGGSPRDFQLSRQREKELQERLDWIEMNAQDCECCSCYDEDYDDYS